MTKDIILFFSTFFLPFVLLIGVFTLADFLSAKPYRWLCQGRQFLNALQMAKGRGISYEEALISLADHGESDLGLQFQVLACWLREGLPLHEALEKVPRFLPRPIEVLVSYGSRTGTLGDILPVGQRTMEELTDKSSNEQYDIFSIVTVAMVLLGISSILFTFVVPKFIAIFADFGGALPPATLFVFENYGNFLILHQCVIAVMVLSYLFIFGGPASQIWGGAACLAWRTGCTGMLAGSGCVVANVSA
jgi:type II secretory pathway component PulF